MKHIPAWMPLLPALALASCGVPRLGPPPQPLSAASLATAESLAAPAAGWPGEAWWTRYGDPQLDALIAEATANSPDARAAQARLRAAAGEAQAAGAQLRPRIGANAEAGFEKQSYNMGFPKEFVPKGWNDYGRATLDLGFDLDLWGRNRAALAAATSEAEAARVDAAQATLMLTTQIASDYAALASLFLQRDVAERAITVYQATLDLTGQRYTRGLDNLGPQELARSRLGTARAQHAELDEQITIVRHRLAALAGAGPDRGGAVARPSLPLARDFGLPSSLALDLVGRRPDLVAARLRAEAAAQRIKVARADFYPNVNLVAFIGVQSLGLSNIAQDDSTVGRAAPAIHLPIFAGGRLAGRYRGARGRYEQAVAVYDATLVGAMREVADAAASLRALGVRQHETTGALDAAERAYGIARQRFDGGLSTYLDVLSAEDALLEARRADAAIKARAFALDVALIGALGGGYAETKATR